MLNRIASQATLGHPPLCSGTLNDGIFRLALSGRWTLEHIGDFERQLDGAPIPQEAQSVEIDLARVDRLDTAGALGVFKLRKRLSTSAPSEFVNAPASFTILIDEVARAFAIPAQVPVHTPLALAVIAKAATGVTAAVRDALSLTVFLGEVAAALLRVAVNPRKFRGTAFVAQLQQTGLNAIPIISLVCFLIGGVVMQQAAQQLRAFGAESMSIDMLGILSLREVGVILAAVMVAGRSASAFTAQIGTMKMREEIDAMRTLGIDPIETLVLPRILALIVALPLLVFIADIMALAGGAVMAGLYLDLDTPIYLQRLNAAVAERHFYVGLIKAPFAALIIGLVGCLEGMSVEGSAESVGTHVTTAVVKAIFLVLILDGVFAIFLSASGF